MIRTVRQYIEKYRLLPSGGKVVVGFSGGADSVALLYILHQLDYPCVAAHCNFHLRGEESERDADFARSFADRLGVPFQQIDFDTYAEATKENISIEMAARRLRYDWFEQLRLSEQADAIAVGHHSDDNVETVLLNLMRGTGVKGLTGIPVRNGQVVRPLLAVSKQTILDFLSAENLSFVTDSTNLEDEYTRNKIRLQLLPLMRTINPSVDEAIGRTADHLREVNRIYDASIAASLLQVFDPSTGEISIPYIKEQPSPESVLYELLKDYGFHRSTVSSVCEALDGLSGKEFLSPGYRLLKDRDRLILTAHSLSSDDELLPPEGSARIEVRFLPNSADLRIEKSSDTAYFDADKLHFPLTVRRWVTGDRFVPFGMKGSQKVSDYFSDHKFNRLQKEQTQLLCSGKDIVWIVGHRTDNRFRVTDRTLKVCRMKVLA